MPFRIRWVVAAGITALALGGLGYFGWPTSAAPHPTIAQYSAPPPDNSTSGVPPVAAGEKIVASVPAPDDAALIEQFRTKFGPHIGNKHSQIKLLEQLTRYLMEHYPDDWRARLRGMLQRLFPELADALYARFEKLEAHNRWLAENRGSLLKMTPAQRREALWAARHEAFGADAEEIWAAERRGEKLHDTLAALDVANGDSAAQKLDQFMAAINQAYGEQAPLFIEQRQTELLGSFLAVNAVQAELRTLPPAQRRATLRQVRSNFGMDEAALTRWDELDQSRDRAWDAGQRYMSDRAGILAVGAPEQQAQQLQQLRVQMFGAEEAAIIQSEEESGFYRFGGERRIGRE